jgi:3,5-epimerase/4-reductase
MNFLTYGKGWIGQQVVQYLKDKNYDFVEGSARIDNIDELTMEIESVKPTHILCCTGRTHGVYNGKEYKTIDYLEQPGKLVENVRDNLFSPVALALICKDMGIHCSQISTACIYDYDATHNTENGYMENDIPNYFGSSYSTVKGFTDRILKLLPCLSGRIRMPINSEVHERNFITKIVNYEKICSVANSMTVLDDMIPIFVDLATKNFIGAVNLTNPGVIEHNEILQMYKEIVDPDFTWQNFSIEEQSKILAAGRSNNYLDTTLLQSLYPDVPHIKDSVRSVLLKMKQNM